MARVLITRRIPGAALERLTEAHEIEVWPERLPPSPERLRELVADAEGLLSMVTDQIDGELLDRSDFVSLHVPLKPETQGLIGARALELMKPTALLINTARGPVVDHEALYRALCDGEIAGAALDVTDPEPLPADHPLLRAPNLLVVPHVGAATVGTREQMTALAVDNLLAGLAGERMPHQANEPRPTH